MNIVSRKEAIAKGLKRYFTGKPCKHGHLCERTVSTGCITCSKIKNKARVKLKRKDPTWCAKESNRKRSQYQRNKGNYLATKRLWRRNNLHSEFVRRSLERLYSGVNLGKTDYESIVGYSQQELKMHLSSLFLSGMSFDNHGSWHIDHIKPIKVFMQEGVTDPKIVNALSNLQPLWAKDNLSKGSRFNHKDVLI